MMRIPLITLIALIAQIGVGAQNISTLGIDATAFPTMRASFYAFNAQGDQQRPTAAELSITENGQPRTITNVNCPPPASPNAISSVLVIDVSGSMIYGFGGNPHIDLAKAAARAWVNGLPLGASECAVASFDGANYLNQDFTSDSVKLRAAIDGLMPMGGTDYDVALIQPAAGGLLVSRNGKHRRVIVMLTDGQPNSDPNVAAIVSEAQQQACTIYCVTLGMYAPQSLRDISAQTGGMVFQYVTTLAQIETIYRQILLTVQGIAPCTVEWETNVRCEEEQAQVELSWQGQTSAGRYEPPVSSIASLEFAPSSWRFTTPVIGTPVTQTITVTARNAPFTVTGITSSNPQYTLTPTSFQLQPNESQTLTLSYTASGLGYTYSRFTLQNALCPQEFFASGGSAGKKPDVPTLRLTYPNGGETFLVGSDTVITWEGIAPSDLVELSYSTNDGGVWRRIDTTRGERYRWTGIPPPGSSRCRVRVRQFDQTYFVDYPKWQEIRTLRGHTGLVSSVSFRPDGEALASGSVDRTVKVWSRETWQELRTFQGHTWLVSSVDYTPDGVTVASAGYDSTIKVWDPITGVVSRTMMGDTAHIVRGLDFSPDGITLASGGFDNNVKLWNPITGREIRTLRGHAFSVASVAFSPDGAMLASGSRDTTVRVWDPATGRELSRLRRHDGQVYCVAFNPDGAILASASADSTVKLWDPVAGRELLTLRGHTGEVWSVAFSPDGSMLAAGCSDGSIRFWDPGSGQEIHTLRGHKKSVRSVAFSPDGAVLASASEDSTIKIWSMGEVSLQVDTSDGLFSIVEPIARSTDVDMGQCLVGLSRDSVVIDLVRNIGTYPLEVRSITFTGPDAPSFLLVSGAPVYTVPMGSGRHGEIRFVPSRVGQHQAQMVIITQNDTLVQTIRGTGVAPSVVVVNRVIDFGTVAIGDRKDTLGVATIRNEGNAPVVISLVRHAGPNSTDFTTIAGGGSFLVQPGEAHTMDLRFTPDDEGRTSGTLQFFHTAAGSPAVVQLFAEGVAPPPRPPDTVWTTIALPDITGVAGDNLRVPLSMTQHANLDQTDAPRRFTATIAINPTVVYVADPSLVCTSIDATTCEYTITGTRGTSDTLMMIPVVATLGTTDYTPLEITSFRWLDTVLPVVVSTRNGSIRVTDICDEGGVRLYVPGTAGYSLASRPNPARSTVEIHFSLAGAGPVIIDLIDQTGRLVLTAVDEPSMAAGRHTRTVDISPLSNGPYIVTLRSGRAVLRGRMDVVR